MSITIKKAGICDTIQDFGRNGYAMFGINAGGTMDKLAMQMANALVGNKLNMAVLEMHFPAPVMRFNEAVLISLAGADFDAVVTNDMGDENLPLLINKTAVLAPGSELRFKNKIAGERCYIAISGGFKLPAWFGSYSTNLKIKEGGFKGRKLAVGDVLELNHIIQENMHKNTIFSWQAAMRHWYADAATCYFLPGPEWHWLDAASQKFFVQYSFTVSLHTDRMGIGLEGELLHALNTEQLVSAAVSYGTIQLLPNGKMIILAADHPTTGGYPRIANIILAHLPKLAQMKPGTKIRLLKTTLENAEELLITMHNELLQMKQAVKFNLLQNDLVLKQRLYI